MPYHLAIPQRCYHLSDFELKNGEPAEIRTLDTRLRRPMLYPAELRAHTILVERMMRIELTPSAWKAEVLPLNYIRIIGAEDEIRTRDPRLGKAMLYP